MFLITFFKTVFHGFSKFAFSRRLGKEVVKKPTFLIFENSKKILKIPISTRDCASIWSTTVQNMSRWKNSEFLKSRKVGTRKPLENAPKMTQKMRPHLWMAIASKLKRNRKKWNNYVSKISRATKLSSIKFFVGLPEMGFFGQKVTENGFFALFFNFRGL